MMQKIWQPNAVWQQFIDERLAQRHTEGSTDPARQ
jgi:hypothetical protein